MIVGDDRVIIGDDQERIYKRLILLLMEPYILSKGLREYIMSIASNCETFFTNL